MIRNLRGHTPEGGPIRTFYEVEGSSGEVKLSFAVPQTADGRSTVVLEFDQDVDVGYGLDHRSLQVPWAPKFKVPVRRMTVDVVGASAVAGEGYQCEGGAEGWHCVRSEPATFDVHVPLAAGAQSLSRLVGVAALLATLGLVAVMIARYRKKLLETRGVYPPVEETSYPTAPQQGYRAPPPLPTPQVSQPVLSGVDVAAVRKQAVVAGLAIFLCSRAGAFTVGDVITCDGGALVAGRG